jgi:hypothetical protein
MLIKGIDETLNPWQDDERQQIVNALREHLKRQPIASGNHAVAALTAAAAVQYLENELRDAAGYVLLRDEICKTMADPDAWDGDESEESVLIRYVQHLAVASHGECDRCGRRIAASERFESVDNVGNWVPEGSPDTAVVICGECA